MRTHAAAAAAVVVLGVAAAVVVARLTADDGPGAPTEPASPATASDGAPAPAAPGGFDPFAPGGLQPPPAAPPPPEQFASGSTPDLAVAGTRLPPVPPKEPWVTVPLRPRDLRTLWIAISSARPELPSCWADEPRARLSPIGGGSTTSAPMRDPAALILEIESDGGKLRVVSTAVETEGDDRRVTVECAREKLNGLSFALPGSLDGSAIARSGTRARMRFVLQ